MLQLETEAKVQVGMTAVHYYSKAGQLLFIHLSSMLSVYIRLSQHLVW